MMTTMRGENGKKMGEREKREKARENERARENSETKTKKSQLESKFSFLQVYKYFVLIQSIEILLCKLQRRKW